MNKIPMTVSGMENLREELSRLKNVERPKISKAIGEARELGDLKENAEYHAAREQQGFVEGRIQEIESKLSLAHVVDVSKLSNNGKIIFGSTTQLVNLDNDKECKYQIVGEDEADIKKSKISVSSPIARALIGKEVGDVVEVNTPNGIVEYEISNVEYV
ncbi:MAG: transcription elongation factor GreA [Legionellales bacterium]|nr:transcription elongation factor GreA [Legionellales bacterium]